LARTVGDFDTLDELRQSIRDQFEENAQQEADAAYIEEVFDVFVSEAEIEYPPDMVEDQIDSIVEDIETRLESQGLSLEDYFKFTNQSEEEFRESSRPQAERAIQRGLMMGELATLEHLDVEGQEVEERIAALSTQWGERAGDVRDALSEPESVRSIASGVLTDKAVQRMVAIAKGEAPPLDEIEAEAEDEVPEGALEAEVASAGDESVPEAGHDSAEDADETPERADRALLDDSEVDPLQDEETPIIEVEHSTETE
jgi:trigger factor